MYNVSFTFLLLSFTSSPDTQIFHILTSVHTLIMHIFRHDKERDGMVCSLCTEYASIPDSVSIARFKGAWVKEVVRGWDNAKKKLKKHSQSVPHLNAKTKMEAKKQTDTKGSVIDVAATGVTSINLRKAMLNRSAVIKLIRIVYHLAVRKLAMYADNFEQTVELITESGDTQLKSFLDSAPVNASYTSNMVLEQYVLAISKWIEDPLLNSLSASDMFTLMADESTDISTIEEMSICARWVTAAGNVEEHFLGLVSLKSCNAETISTELIAFLKLKKIQANKMRGQGYDGASTMSGKKNGVQQRMRVQCSPKALYVHCRAHILQLALVESSVKVPKVKTVISTMMAIWKTFHFSPKKAARLQEIQKVLNHPVLKMIKPSDTRWAAYERCVSAVRKSLKPLVEVFEHLHAETGKYFSKYLTENNIVKQTIIVYEWKQVQ